MYAYLIWISRITAPQIKLSEDEIVNDIKEKELRFAVIILFGQIAAYQRRVAKDFGLELNSSNFLEVVTEDFTVRNTLVSRGGIIFRVETTRELIKK